VFQEAEDLGAKMDFLKERIGIEVGFGHASFLGIDLLKFQVSSYSALDKIDVGVYVAFGSETALIYLWQAVGKIRSFLIPMVRPINAIGEIISVSRTIYGAKAQYGRPSSSSGLRPNLGGGVPVLKSSKISERTERESP